MKKTLRILKDFIYVGKGQWMPKDSEKIEQKSKKKKKKVKKVVDKFDAKKIIDWLKSVIEESGYKGLTTKRLLTHFEIKRRTSENVSKLNSLLSENGLTIFPRLTVDTKLDEPLRIYSFPVEQLGDLFESEEELENFIDKKNLFHLLNLRKNMRQHSPKHTRDKMDFWCVDENGIPVALELKNKDGGKTAVEQVLRYKGTLKQYGEKVRGILVTGVRDVYTARALHGMTKEEQAEFQWFLYNYNKATQTLKFEEVTHEFIAKNLKQVI
ncbi:MAG: hypothetical protein OHK0019_06250 [Saprospiraceae bacterium]